MLRGPEKPTGAVVVRANWRDNPRFPAVLEQERQDHPLDARAVRPRLAGWLCTVLEGAYFAARSRRLAQRVELGRRC